MIEVLKQMYQLLLTEPHAPAVCDQLEVILRKTIAELESQEPVGEFGWAANIPNTIGEVHWKNGSPPIGTKLYTHPPQRTERKPIAMLFGSLPVSDTPSQRQWVELTLTDREKLRDKFEGWNYPAILVDAIADMLKEKTT